MQATQQEVQPAQRLRIPQPTRHNRPIRGPNTTLPSQPQPWTRKHRINHHHGANNQLSSHEAIPNGIMSTTKGDQAVRPHVHHCYTPKQAGQQTFYRSAHASQHKLETHLETANRSHLAPQMPTAWNPPQAVAPLPTQHYQRDRCPKSYVPHQVATRDARR
ncbi:hypothetical protein NQZ68_014261 [Dissostichus eleginoides]|nr:hypothetical protein NQZ68_014261 [Dissostichus eleginoides]